MELNFIVTILDRDRRERMDEVLRDLRLGFSLTMLGAGTATSEHLSLHGLVMKEKAIVCTVADGAETKHLLRAAKRKMYIDVPGNGIMLSVPMKSVGGAQTLAYLTDQKPVNSDKPKMEFDYELILVILNEGYSETVMEAARPAGATGGTVLTAKGTGREQAQKFLGLSLAEEKDLLLILARADKKADIMRAIMENAGPGTKPGAISFSLPVSDVAGLRRIDD